MAIRIKGAAPWAAFFIVLVKAFSSSGIFISAQLALIFSPLILYLFAHATTGSYKIAGSSALLWTAAVFILNDFTWLRNFDIFFLVFALLFYKRETLASILFILSAFFVPSLLFFVPLVFIILFAQRRWVAYGFGLVGIVLFVAKMKALNIEIFHTMPEYWYIEVFFIIVFLATIKRSSRLKNFLIYFLLVSILFGNMDALFWTHGILIVLASSCFFALLDYFISGRHYNWAKGELTQKQKRYIESAYEKQAAGKYAQLLDEFGVIVNGKRVIDVGCGPGQWLKELKLHQPKLLVGMDRDKKFLAAAKERLGSGVLFVLGSGDYMPLKTHFFDRVFSILVIPYVPDEDAYIKELCRVLHPGGQLLISGHGLGFPLRYIKQKRFAPLILYISTLLYFFFGEKIYLNTLQSVKVIIKKLRRAGFSITRVKVSEKTLKMPHTYMILCEKISGPTE